MFLFAGGARPVSGHITRFISCPLKLASRRPSHAGAHVHARQARRRVSARAESHSTYWESAVSRCQRANGKHGWFGIFQDCRSDGAVTWRPIFDFQSRAVVKQHLKNDRPFKRCWSVDKLKFSLLFFFTPFSLSYFAGLSHLEKKSISNKLAIKS